MPALTSSLNYTDEEAGAQRGGIYQVHTVNQRVGQLESRTHSQALRIAPPGVYQQPREKAGSRHEVHGQPRHRTPD